MDFSKLGRPSRSVVLNLNNLNKSKESIRAMCTNSETKSDFISFFNEMIKELSPITYQ